MSVRWFDLIGGFDIRLNQGFVLPAKLILPIFSCVLRILQHWGRHTHPPPFTFSLLFLSSAEPLKNNSRALGALLIWSRHAQGKSELYFLQNTDQRGKNWPCFRGLFTSNLCLFSFCVIFLLFCRLVLLCLFFSSLLVLRVFFFCLCGFFLKSPLPLHTWTISLFFLCPCLSLSTRAVFLVSGSSYSQILATHTHVCHCSPNRYLCNPNLCVHTESAPRFSQIMAVLFLSSTTLPQTHTHKYILACVCLHVNVHKDKQRHQ